MADTLIVQLIPPIRATDEEEHGAIDCAAQWLRLSGEAASGMPHPDQGQLSRLLQQPPGDCRWIVLLPGEDVLTATVKLPPKRRRQALKALPFILEDSIISDVALEHLAVGSDNAHGDVLVAITRKSLLRDVLRQFADAGITPSCLLPDYAMLPERAESWQVLLSGDRALVRRPDRTGFSTPVSRLALMLNSGQKPEAGGSVREIRIIRPPDLQAPSPGGAWQVHEQLQLHPLQYLATGLASESLNLLQGEFRMVQKEDWKWRPWAAAATLALAVAGLELLHTGLQTARLNDETSRLQASLTELARQALPDVQQIRDPQSQLLIAWRQLQNGGAGGAQFLPLLNRVSPAVNQQPVEVQGINFKDGTLTLALRGNSLQQLDKIREQIERQGLAAKLLDASTDADQARSNLVIQAAGAQPQGGAG
jgi:general secretion pathway protein L